MIQKQTIHIILIVLKMKKVKIKINPKIFLNDVYEEIEIFLNELQEEK